ncbi:MAG TPA: hypothetical protein DHW39_01005 [Erysipelotrichaceae bacterium]|nr:hypothetical protein [Erysipelotrichaceae bacterium]
MSNKSISSLSTKRIIISLILLLGAPVTSLLTDLLIHQRWISRMFALNIFVSVLIIYDWNLFGIHYNRSKKSLGDTLIFTVTGCALLALWHYAASRFFNAHAFLPPGYVLRMYGYARPGMLIAFSFMQAAWINIGYKVLTDRMDIRGKEIQSILMSAIVFGLLVTLLQGEYSLSVLISSYLYNLILTAVISYLYNQSHSMIPGILAMTLVNLAVMILSM